MTTDVGRNFGCTLIPNVPLGPQEISMQAEQLRDSLSTSAHPKMAPPGRSVRIVRVLHSDAARFMLHNKATLAPNEYVWTVALTAFCGLDSYEI